MRRQRELYGHLSLHSRVDRSHAGQPTGHLLDCSLMSKQTCNTCVEAEGDSLDGADLEQFQSSLTSEFLAQLRDTS